MKEPLVSVVFATKNEANETKRLLESLVSQTYKNIEIICIDDSTSDNTVEVIKSYPTTLIQQGPERSAKRNAGIKVAKGEWILWLDADMSLAPSTIESCVNTCQEHGYDYLIVQEQIPEKTLFTRMRNFENSLLLNTVIAVPRFIKAELLKKINGFDEAMTGAEDWDMSRRLNDLTTNKGILLLSKNVGITHHEEQITYKRFIEKKKRYVEGCQMYEQKWGKNDYYVQRQLHAFPRLIHLLNTKGNLKKIVTHPILFVSMLLFKALPSLFIYKTTQ